MNASQSTEPMAYIGKCPDCGAFTSATVDDPEQGTWVRRDVREFMKDGLIIERVTCQFVRDNAGPCKPECNCKHCVKRRAAEGKS